MGIMRVKTPEQSVRDAEAPEFRLRRVLRAVDLLGMGVGVIVGTGIFVLTGVAAATEAGPSIAISFVVSGVACGLAALCYAEFASIVPVAGSAYTFSYASLGELLAWIIGWASSWSSSSAPPRWRSAGRSTSPRLSVRRG